MTNANDLADDSDFQRHVYRVLAMSAVLLIACGTIVFSAFEKWSYVDSFYFSVVTATTVGFGDLTPDSDGAKLFTVVFIVFGISIMATFLDARFKRHAHRRAGHAKN